MSWLILWALSMSGALASGAERIRDTFDEALAKSEYGAFVYRWHVAAVGEAEAKKRWQSWGVPLPTRPEIGRWPVDARGVYGSAYVFDNVHPFPAKLAWRLRDRTDLHDYEWHAPQPVAALMSWMALGVDCLEDPPAPRTCVAGACYFVPRCGRTSYWVALRSGPSGPLLAGVLTVKGAPAKPTTARGFAPWLAGIDLAFGPAPDVPFDEAKAKVDHAAFLYRWHLAALGAVEAKRRWRYPGGEAPMGPEVAAWPVDARGVFANADGGTGSLQWRAAGLTDPPAFEPRETMPVGNLLATVTSCYESSPQPTTCVPGACYFEPNCEYFDYSYWLALRAGPGGLVIAGVLTERTWLDDPKTSRRVRPWLAEIDKVFGPAPDRLLPEGAAP